VLGWVELYLNNSIAFNSPFMGGVGIGGFRQFYYSTNVLIHKRVMGILRLGFTLTLPLPERERRNLFY
jgi:hypothetical protein